ncbi:MAG: MCE family protein [Saprospiraceae bacterium]|nr:MCE family protein [Saprospiraceae bacterium]
MLKISNEIKVALLAIIAILIGFWGFKFLKGINVLTSARVFYVKYDNVDQLRPSAPIFYNGLQVGLIKDMYVDPTDDKTIIAVLNIDSKMDIPKNTEAAITGLTLMGGKAIKLVINGTCEGDNCAESGDYLKGTTDSFIHSLLGPPEQVEAYSDRLKQILTADLDSIARANPNGLGGSVNALDNSLRNIELMTSRINRLLDASTNNITSTTKNVADITRAFRDNNEEISATIANLAEISNQLKKAGLDKSSQKATAAIDSVTLSLASLRNTLNTSTRTISRVDTLAQGLMAGKGLAGKTLTDEELYYNLLSTSRHLFLLMQDLRLHPERYTKVRVKLFGKHKGVKYTEPVSDPAYQMLIDSLERDLNRKLKQ